jgi:hypothetical protein
VKKEREGCKAGERTCGEQRGEARRLEESDDERREKEDDSPRLRTPRRPTAKCRHHCSIRWRAYSRESFSILGNQHGMHNPLEIVPSIIAKKIVG